MQTLAEKHQAEQFEQTRKAGPGLCSQANLLSERVTYLDLHRAIGRQALERLLHTDPQAQAFPYPNTPGQLDHSHPKKTRSAGFNRINQRMAQSPADNPAGLDHPDASQLHASLQNRGSPLPETVRALFEARFGRDLGQVRVHTDETAQRSALSLQARAFTVGEHIGFGPGQYQPGSQDGRRLLAHELVHVVQQASGQTQTASLEVLEREAREAAMADSPGSMLELHENRTSFGQLQMDRNPDITANGLNTFFLGVSSYARVMAIQIGIQPQATRVSIQAAALTTGLRNPPLSERSMLLAISPTAPLSPRIISETENELPQGGVYQKTFDVQLNSDPATPIVSVVMIYGQSRQAIPFPDDSGGVWRPTNVETGWIGMDDGFRQVAVNFPAEIAGSFYSQVWQPYIHPRLGYGFINVETHRFYPYPQGRPDLRGQEEAIRTYIHFIPIIGSLVMAGEALVGRSIWGRPLSTTERALLGAGAVLAEIGPILRAGSAAARTTAAVTRLTAVTRLSHLEALRLVVGSRYLTDAEAATLERLATEVRAGRALSEAEEVVVNRLMGKLNEGARAAAVRAEVQATTGAARQPGRFTDLGTSTSVDETRVGQTLARDLNADVVRVPESTTSGVRTGDYLVDDIFVETYSPQTGNIENLLRQATSKHQQAGVLVIDLTRSPLAEGTVVGSLNRIFGRPEAADLYRIIVVKGNRIVADALRTAAVPGSQLPGILIRGGASVGADQTQ